MICIITFFFFKSDIKNSYKINYFSNLNDSNNKYIFIYIISNNSIVEYYLINENNELINQKKINNEFYLIEKKELKNLNLNKFEINLNYNQPGEIYYIESKILKIQNKEIIDDFNLNEKKFIIFNENILKYCFKIKNYNNYYINTSVESNDFINVYLINEKNISKINEKYFEKTNYFIFNENN